MSSSSRNPDAYLKRLEWTTIRRLDGLLQGDYRTLFRGFGLDLAGIREYQLEDDVRHIDWNVTARLQSPYVRQFHEDREITAWFLLDLSPSVDFGSVEVSKRAVATELVALIARLLTRHGNRVGAILYTGRSQTVIPAGAGRRHVLYLLDRLMSLPALQQSPPTRLGDLLQTAYDVVRRRSLVFLVSDFFSAPGWERTLTYLGRRHEVLAVRVFDPLERALPDVGMLVMRDSETGEQLIVDTHSRHFRRKFQEAALRHEELLRSGLARAGIDGLEISTRERVIDAIARFIELRRRRVGASGRGARVAT
jgi:uncharacterized protein (DUF58 family)